MKLANNSWKNKSNNIRFKETETERNTRFGRYSIFIDNGTAEIGEHT